MSKEHAGPCPQERVTVREACRQRMPLGGVDAEALEHGMTQLEDMLRSAREALRTIQQVTKEAKDPIGMSIESIARHGLKKSSEFGFQD